MGDPGNTHNSTYFQYMYLWNKTEASLVFSDQVQVVNGLKIPPLVLGDGVFPLRSWTTKPYEDAALSKEKHYFNYRGSKSRMVTEEVFDQLEGTFRVLQKNVKVTRQP